MQFVAAGLWWVVQRVFGWAFSALGLTALTRLVAGVLRPIAGAGSTWLSRLLVGGSVAGGLWYTGVGPKAVEEGRQLLIDLVMWVVDQALGLALLALSLIDSWLPSVSSTVGRIPSWAVEIIIASGIGRALFIGLSAAAAIKIIRMVPGVK